MRAHLSTTTLFSANPGVLTGLANLSLALANRVHVEMTSVKHRVVHLWASRNTTFPVSE
jgi:hypothetical protein